MPIADSIVPRHFRAATAIGLALCMGFVIFMAYFVFFGQSLRLDEAQSLWQTSHSVAKIFNVIGQDVHVPFYHLMLYFWQLFFGNGVTTARLLSLLFYALVIPAMYLLGSLVFDQRTAWYATLLITVSPFLQWYGNEVRMYSLFALIVILNQYFFLRIYRSPTPAAWAGYGVTIVLGLFTHYFFAFSILTQVVFFLIYHRDFERGAIYKFLTVAAIGLMFFIPWVLYVYSLGTLSNSAPLIAPPTSINLFNAFSEFLFGFQDDRVNTILVSLWPLITLFGFLAMRENKRLQPEVVYFFMSFLLPVVLIFGASLAFRPIFLTRYLVFTLPPLYLFISWLFSTYPAALSRLCKTGLILVMLCTLGIEAESATIPVKEDFRAAAAYLSQNAAQDDAVAVSAPFIIYPVEYYYSGAAPLTTLPVWDRFANGPVPPFDESKLPDELKQIGDHRQNLWILFSYDQGYEERLRLYLDTHYQRERVVPFSPGMTLYEYKLRYD